MFRQNKAQTLSEYAVIVMVITFMFIAMQTYIKRGLQGKLKDMTDAVITNRQYVTRESESSSTSSSTSISNKRMSDNNTAIDTNETAAHQADQYSVSNTNWLDLLP